MDHHAVITGALGYGWQVNCSCGAHARRMEEGQAEGWVKAHLFSANIDDLHAELERV